MAEAKRNQLVLDLTPDLSRRLAVAEEETDMKRAHLARILLRDGLKRLERRNYDLLNFDQNSISVRLPSQSQDG